MVFIFYLRFLDSFSSTPFSLNCKFFVVFICNALVDLINASKLFFVKCDNS